ncbi:MAG: ADP-ribosylation/crystallin J1 [Bacteroidota bacterium]
MNTKLYRPVGIKELELIEKSNMKEFPPRLSWQPIFYPVLNFDYAAQIAKDWNTKDEFSGYAGFVTEFEITKAYFNTYEVQNVGGANHNELWVPSEKMDEFNKQIINGIRVSGAFYGDQFEGEKKY